MSPDDARPQEFIAQMGLRMNEFRHVCAIPDPRAASGRGRIHVHCAAVITAALDNSVKQRPHIVVRRLEPDDRDIDRAVGNSEFIAPRRGPTTADSLDGARTGRCSARPQPRRRRSKRATAPAEGRSPLQSDPALGDDPERTLGPITGRLGSGPAPDAETDAFPGRPPGSPSAPTRRNRRCECARSRM